MIITESMVAENQTLKILRATLINMARAAHAIGIGFVAMEDIPDCPAAIAQGFTILQDMGCQRNAYTGLPQERYTEHDIAIRWIAGQWLAHEPDIRAKVAKVAARSQEPGVGFEVSGNLYSFAHYTFEMFDE